MIASTCILHGPNMLRIRVPPWKSTVHLTYLGDDALAQAGTTPPSDQTTRKWKKAIDGLSEDAFAAIREVTQDGDSSADSSALTLEFLIKQPFNGMKERAREQAFVIHILARCANGGQGEGGWAGVDHGNSWISLMLCLSSNARQSRSKIRCPPSHSEPARAVSESTSKLSIAPTKPTQCAISGVPFALFPQISGRK